MSEQFAEQLRRECMELSLTLTDLQVEQFYKYYELLIEWNQVMNLTAITEMEEVITKHFVDSLSIVKAFGELADQERSVIDIGTGAGFPGIPLKIVFPELDVTLLDSLNKRVKFLNQVIDELNLTRINAIHGRAEDIGNNILYREAFDLCVSRAVANISTLSEYCLPLVKVGGLFISYKSGKIEEELESGKHAIFLLGGKLRETCLFKLPGNEAERSLIIIDKKEKTGKKYPRKAGLPSKEPLK